MADWLGKHHTYLGAANPKVTGRSCMKCGRPEDDELHRDPDEPPYVPPPPEHTPAIFQSEDMK